MAAPSELGRLAAPLARAFELAWQRMHLWIAAMAVLYALSGITVVQSDEVAVVLRWGRLVGETPALQEHGPGLLFAFPRPVDEVVRVKTKHVSELRITTLTDAGDFPFQSDTLDPTAVGYALTGDQNIVHVEMTAHYQVRDSAEHVFLGPKAEGILRVEVSAAMLRSLGEMGIDHVLSDRRKDLIAAACRRAQAGLDAAHSGLALVSLELTHLAPPRILSPEFDAVQSAYITAETQRKDAQAYSESLLPRARAETDSDLQSARAESATAEARAAGEAAGFLALDVEYQKNRPLVRERIYRDAVERAISRAQAVRWVPPPIGGRYSGLRLMIEPDPAGSAKRWSGQSQGQPGITPEENDWRKKEDE